MRRLRLLALACGCATVIAGTVSAHAATITGTGGARYVAMGDSYSSGEGNPPFESNVGGGCDRSISGAYADLIAADLGLANNGTAFDFEACGGATTGDLWPGAGDARGNTAFTTYQETGLVAGEAGLGPNTKLVTLTIGGNDVGIGTAAAECIIGGCIDPSLSIFANIRNAVQNIAALQKTLVATYDSIKTAAPNAAIYVLGYPALFTDNWIENSLPGCLANTGLTAGSIAWLYQRELQLDGVVKAAATQAGVHFVDPNATGTAYSFAGHGICSSSPWFHPLWQNLLPFSDLVYTFHPTVAGQQALAAALVAAGATNLATASN